MVMDPRFDDLSFSADDLNFETYIPILDRNTSPKIANGFKSAVPAGGFDSSAVPLPWDGPDALNNMPAISVDDLSAELAFSAGPDGGSFYPSASLGKSMNVGEESLYFTDDTPSSDPVLEYISTMLMEENMEEKVWTSPDNFALQNIENSFYDALGEQYPGLPDEFQNFDASQFIGSRNSSLFGYNSKESSVAAAYTAANSSSLTGNGSIKRSVGTPVTSTKSSNIIDPNWLHDHGKYNQTVKSVVHPLDQGFQINLDISSPSYEISLGNSIYNPNGLVESSVQCKNAYNDNEYVLHFKRGSEEANKFLPPSSQLVINFDNVRSGYQLKRGIVEVDVHENNNDREDTNRGSRGRKNPEREGLGLVGARAAQQMASLVEVEEDELSEMFNKVLLWTWKAEPHCSTDSCLSTDASKDLQTTASFHGSSGGSVEGRRRASNSSVDLRALLILCAQALSSNDSRTATELLKQIRENSSPSGDGSERLAHYFANGLEARLAGSNCGSRSCYTLISSKKSSMADVLKANQLHFSYCPVLRLCIFYMNYLILKLSQKAPIIHIIDFGIGLGFKWPILIQKLGEQVGGPPRLRITGIELSQPGLCSSHTIEETGRRLAQYCERFNVPFEYNSLPSRDWVAIKIEDLNIQSGEIVVVSSFFRFDTLPETVDDDSQKDAMLDLIRRIKPSVFFHVAKNGNYNSPFFVTRFKQALLFWSSIYDMVDTTISGEHKNLEERTVLERDVYGQLVMDVVAYEGLERVERPETYKQWQARYGRAGFKQYPLDRAMMKKLRHMLEAWYHKEFVLDEDGEWMLMGWKGRILVAAAAGWVPI